jgi:hypothetical protein
VVQAYGPEGLAPIRVHPDFRAFCEAVASIGSARPPSWNPALDWLTRDYVRLGLLLGLGILDAMSPSGATVRDLAAEAVRNGSCSRSRVVAFVEYAVQAGWVGVPHGPEIWTQRRLQLKAPFGGYFHQALDLTARAARNLAPEIDSALDRLAEPRSLRLYLMEIGMTLMSHPELNRPQDAPLGLFILRERGMTILQHWLVNQTEPRTQLLEHARISRRDLSMRFNVSRAHVNQLLADAEAEGLLRLSRSDEATFAPELSDELERYFALNAQCVVRASRAILGSDV